MNQTPKEMKVAIPTDDGLTVNEQFAPTGSFLVSTLQFGEVVEQEMLWAANGEVITSTGGPFKNLLECDTVIVRGIDSTQKNFLQSQNIVVVNTEETIIMKVLMNYLTTVMKKETDTCCCP
jgi:predicted Fe-Mo cluster-binding NifX family protein